MARALRDTRAWVWGLTLVAAVAMTACGAKTGLKVPDGGPTADNDPGRSPDDPVPGDGGPSDNDLLGPPSELEPPLESTPCYEAAFEAGNVDVSMATEARLGRADVTFLIDQTASMQDEIDRIRNRLRDRLAPAIADAIPDVQLAVATFADFPRPPYGQNQDLPFNLKLPSSNDIARVQAAVDSIELRNGRDAPESQAEALYQLATGEGLRPFVEPSSGCAAGGIGYACFRRDALPVVLLFTDAPFHEGPDGENPYDFERLGDPGEFPERDPRTYAEALDAIRAIDTRVIGFDSGESDSRSETHMRQLARDTGAVDSDGDPLVFDIGTDGRRLGTEVVDAIRTFVDTAVFDVDTTLVDGDRTDGVDATEFVQRVVPVQASPANGIEAIDRAAETFRGVETGTQVTFQLVLRNDAVAPGDGPQVFPLDVIFRGDGRAQLGRRTVRIVVPGRDGAGCEAL